MNTTLLYPNLGLPTGKKKIFFWVTFGIYFLYAVVLLPLSSFVGSDIRFQGTWLYEFLLFMTSTIELLAFCWVFAHIIYYRSVYGVRAALQGIGWFLLASVLRYVMTLVVTWYIDGIKPSEIWIELVFLAVYILLDVTQVSVVLVLSHLLLRGDDALYEIRTNAMLARGDAAPNRADAVFSSFNVFSLRGCVSTAALAAGGVVAFVRVIGRIIYDISYGAPADGVDLAWMIFYYVSDIAIGVMCWALISWLTMRIYRSEKQ